MYLRALYEMFCGREHFGPILAIRRYFTSAKRGLKLQVFYFFFSFHMINKMIPKREK